MDLLPIPPPNIRGNVNVLINIGTLPKHIESELEFTLSHTKSNPNMGSVSTTPCTSLTCIIHKTYIVTTNSILIEEPIGSPVLEGFYLLEMTLTKGNQVGDSLSRVYGIWGSNSGIVIGLPYSIFKPIEFA